MYCLDTNIVIDIFRGDESLRNKLLMIQNLGADVAVTTLTLCELYKGAYLASRRDEAIKLVKDFMKSIVLLMHSEKSCELFGLDNSLLKEKDKPVPELDLMIACVAKAEGKILVTRDRKHFELIPDLNVEVW